MGRASSGYKSAIDDSHRRQLEGLRLRGSGEAAAPCSRGYEELMDWVIPQLWTGGAVLSSITARHATSPSRIMLDAVCVRQV